MPTPTWQRLDESRRQAITDAAEAEFAANGFSGGSLNVIARDAGVAKGSLFQYFTDKADFYVYLSELASNRIRSYMEVLISEQDWTGDFWGSFENPVSYTHLRAHETTEHLVCRRLLEKKKKKQY